MVAQRQRVHLRPRRDTAGEHFPFHQNGFDVGYDEVGEPHRLASVPTAPGARSLWVNVLRSVLLGGSRRPGRPGTQKILVDRPPKRNCVNPEREFLLEELGLCAPQHPASFASRNFHFNVQGATARGAALISSSLNGREIEAIIIRRAPRARILGVLQVRSNYADERRVQLEARCIPRVILRLLIATT